jgi:hypothetical protein
MQTPVPPELRCAAKTADSGDIHSCGKQTGHTDAPGARAASRRIHQDFETGHRWPTTLDDDPLRDFVHLQRRDPGPDLFPGPSTPELF